MNDVIRRRVGKSVRRALDRGTIKRDPCEICGNIHSEAHHDDYAKPLEIKWLCRTHHCQLHWRNPNYMPHIHKGIVKDYSIYTMKNSYNENAEKKIRNHAIYEYWLANRDKMSYRQIGREFGDITGERVRQLINREKRKLAGVK